MEWRTDMESAPRDGPVLLDLGGGSMALARWYAPWECWMWLNETPPRDPASAEIFGIGNLVPRAFFVPTPLPSGE